LPCRTFFGYNVVVIMFENIGEVLLMKKADVILHPIRMRIIQALLNGNRMTAQQLQERLQDVPQATLYRHLKKMVEARVLAVAEEIPNRGTLEKVYVIPEKGAEITAEELNQASFEEQLAYFTNFAASLIGEYGRYLQNNPDTDLLKDGVTYRQFAVNLSDEENIELIMGIRKLLVEAMQKEPNEDRRRRLFTVIGFPEE